MPPGFITSLTVSCGVHGSIYLSVCVLVVFVIAGVVVLLDEAEIFLPLPLQDAVSPLCVGWQVTLKERDGGSY